MRTAVAAFAVLRRKLAALAGPGAAAGGRGEAGGLQPRLKRACAEVAGGPVDDDDDEMGSVDLAEGGPCGAEEDPGDGAYAAALAMGFHGGRS